MYVVFQKQSSRSADRHQMPALCSAIQHIHAFINKSTTHRHRHTTTHNRHKSVLVQCDHVHYVQTYDWPCACVISSAGSEKHTPFGVQVLWECCGFCTKCLAITSPLNVVKSQSEQTSLSKLQGKRGKVTEDVNLLQL